MRAKRCHQRAKLSRLNTQAAKEVGKQMVEEIVKGKVNLDYKILISDLQ